MNPNDVQYWARKSGMTSREYLLKEIAEWEDVLQSHSDEFEELDDTEFPERVAREVDQYRAESVQDI